MAPGLTPVLLRRAPLCGLVVMLLADAAGAQTFNVNWYTIDGGGGSATGGGFTLSGTIGQADAGLLSGTGFQCAGGFWPGGGSIPACYANCDNSTTPPILNVLDFACFLNKFAAADPYANCDNSTTPPTLNVLDFACFLNAFAAGCP